MGIVKALTNSVSGVFADQWKDIITAGAFDEQSAVVPGRLKNVNNGRGANTKGSENIITNGSKIFVPENTAAFIFSASAIENIIVQPGVYEYQAGEASIFNGEPARKAIFGNIKDRVGYGGISPQQKQVAYVNLREIRNIKFGTHGPQVYNDMYYGVDLEIFAYGSFTIRIVNPERFIRNYVPANTSYYSFGDSRVRSQLLSEFLQSFSVALNQLSNTCRISHIPSHSNEIAQKIATDQFNAGTWESRFGFSIQKVAIENIEFSDESRELVRQFSEKKMDMRAYDEVSQKTSNIAAQQKIANGIEKKGIGNAGGMLMGMNLAQGMANTSSPEKQRPAMSIDEQIESVKKLKELMDAGILTEAEFNAKKKEIMGL
ncbi:MAG: SPFH domain-containing protein [Bilifractor sp.]|jgi:membrane protease subunit (stomatin/prohibitin family)